MSSVKIRLSIMMFLQYFTWGAWVVPASGYLGKYLKFSGGEIGWFYNTSQIGAIIAPLFVGLVADRFFATEKILAVLHFIGAILLLIVSQQNQFAAMFGLMLVYGLCFMPTLALTNSICFANIEDPSKEFPLLRVFGTIGWIVAGLAVGFFFGQDTSTFFMAAGGSSLLLAIFCLFLPHTPPSGKSSGDVFGLGTLSMLKQPSFAIFIAVSLLICIPLSCYYQLCNLFLVQIGVEKAAAIQSIGQMSEVVFMAAMPWFIVRLGVKNMLMVGMAAWVLRYLCFSSQIFALIIIGLILHGICYDFYFVASQIYVDSKAPADQRASAQSFFALVTFGFGMLIGNLVAGKLVDTYPPLVADGPNQWTPIWLWPAGMAAVTLVIFALAFHDKLEKKQLEAAAH